MKKLLKLKYAIIFGSLIFISLFYFSIWIEGWIAVFVIMAAVLIGISLCVFILIGIFKLINKKDNGLLISITIGIAIILLVIYRPFEQLVEHQKSSVIFNGYCEHTVTSLSLILRKDKSFEYNNGAFLASEIYYGTYFIKHDTLTLNFTKNLPKQIKTKLYLDEEGASEIGDSLTHHHYFKKLSKN